jgi:preprotein translocase subunit SecG
MENIFLIINLILAVLLVFVILIQRSEGGALGLGISQDNFVSSRSAGNFLTKTTAIIATLFILTSIALTIISKQELSSRSSSVLEKVEEKQESTEPEIPKSD